MDYSGNRKRRTSNQEFGPIFRENTRNGHFDTRLNPYVGLTMRSLPFIA